MNAGPIHPDRLREVFAYDAESGALKWRVTLSPRAVAGSLVAFINKDGYLQAKVDGKNLVAHRIAWAMTTGEWPIGRIDHRDGVRTRNCWANLRDGSARLNNENRRKAQSNSATGVLGVTWVSGKNKWLARIGTGGRVRAIGLFSTLEDASDAYLTEKRRVHEGCTI